MSTESTHAQERTDSADSADDADAPVTGPHDGYDRRGRPDYRYWRCERCGLESVDPRLRRGCFRCGAGRDDRTDCDEQRRAGADGAE